jgi:hypothetical protein
MGSYPTLEGKSYDGHNLKGYYGTAASGMTSNLLV